MPSYYNDLHNEEQDWDPVIITGKQNHKNMQETGVGYHFGNHLQTARKRANLTAQELTQKLGIPLSQLEEYENCERIPTKGLISRINRICNCNLFLYV